MFSNFNENHYYIKAKENSGLQQFRNDSLLFTKLNFFTPRTFNIKAFVVEKGKLLYFESKTQQKKLN